MKKVAILMSTYNGEKYIRKQIESLQKQTYKNWNLYIRDDGSYDKTIQIIEKIRKKDNRIILFSKDGKNLKPARSFLILTNKIKADYYFFCDQDDYWVKDKMQLMLNEIEKKNNDIPQVVYCNLKCVNENLIPKKYGFDKLVGSISGINRFISNDMPGCVMLFNKATRDLAKKYKPNYNNITMHDWWIALIAETFGQTSFLNRRLVLYRQHGNNTLGAGRSGNSFKKLFQKDLILKQRKLVGTSFKQDMEFKKTFYIILPPKIRVLLNDMYSCRNKSIAYRFHFMKKYSFKLMSPIRTFAYDWVFIFMFKDRIPN